MSSLIAVRTSDPPHPPANCLNFFHSRQLSVSEVTKICLRLVHYGLRWLAGFKKDFQDLVRCPVLSELSNSEVKMMWWVWKLQMMSWVSIVMLSTLGVSASAGLPCDYTIAHLNTRNISSLKYSLEREVSGLVVAPWDTQYEKFRAIHNRACCQKPLLIVRPRNRKVSKLSFDFDSY